MKMNEVIRIKTYEPTREKENNPRKLGYKAKEVKKWYLLPLFLVLLATAIFWFYLSVNYFDLFESYNSEIKDITLVNLRVVPNIFFNWVLISLTIFSLIAWAKNGFDRLNNDEKNVIFGGGIFWMITGIVLGIILGVIEVGYGGVGGAIIYGVIGGMGGGFIMGICFAIFEIGWNWRWK